MIKIKVKKGVPQHMEANDNRTFDEWFYAVDHLLQYNLGISTDDLPDCPYSQWYADRLRPIRAANKALTYAQK